MAREINAQKCLDILREIKDVAFATVDENGKPQVRIIDVMIVEDEKLYFCTGRGKDFYSQLVANGDVAITGLNKDFQMVRLSGKAEKLAEQKHWIDRIFEENPVMNGVYPGESRYVLEPFCISAGELEFFDLGVSPIFRVSFTLGGEKGVTSAASSGRVADTAAAGNTGADGTFSKKGFFITDACIGCGKCGRNCPQQCIDEGRPFFINQEHCLHCGLCFENCPVQAIVKRG
ncbi:4Fe-4S binding protein [Mobilibacterium timonense]|uniref:pyridoxamine 5'-phosphate oxidase family protein n=1 Tax=Mobilibacterium timonense TaxID=1871012 RepID=UPI003A93AAD5